MYLNVWYVSNLSQTLFCELFTKCDFELKTFKFTKDLWVFFQNDEQLVGPNISDFAHFFVYLWIQNE